MQDRELLDRMAHSLVLFSYLQADLSQAASYFEVAPGVNALITPTTPDRSVLNGVDYQRLEQLEAALPQLAEEYERAGVRAWTVWVADSDSAARDVLEAAGHKFDAEPRAMAVELSECRLAAGAEGLDWSTDCEAPLLGQLNARAYGYPEESFVPAFERFDERSHRYIAFLDGEPASTLIVADHEGDCGVYWVATVPEAQGRGLSGGLLRQALIDARERGCETTSLQATKPGYPVYKRIGYRDLGGLQMWERRTAA